MESIWHFNCPLESGKLLVRDATCPHTFEPSLAVSLLPRATLTRCYRILWVRFRRQYRQQPSPSANGEVWHVFEAQQATQPTKRGQYAWFIPEEKAEVGKRAALPEEHGVVATVLGLHVYCRNLVWELVVWAVLTNGRG